MKTIALTAADFENLPTTGLLPEDAINLEYVEAVEAYRTWVKADARFYAAPASERVGKAPRMPAYLPGKTEYLHATSYEAL